MMDDAALAVAALAVAAPTVGTFLEHGDRAACLLACPRTFAAVHLHDASHTWRQQQSAPRDADAWLRKLAALRAHKPRLAALEVDLRHEAQEGADEDQGPAASAAGLLAAHADASRWPAGVRLMLLLRASDALRLRGPVRDGLRVKLCGVQTAAEAARLVSGPLRLALPWLSIRVCGARAGADLDALADALLAGDGALTLSSLGIEVDCTVEPAGCTAATVAVLARLPTVFVYLVAGVGAAAMPKFVPTELVGVATSISISTSLYSCPGMLRWLQRLTDALRGADAQRMQQVWLWGDQTDVFTLEPPWAPDSPGSAFLRALPPACRLVVGAANLRSSVLLVFVRSLRHLRPASPLDLWLPCASVGLGAAELELLILHCHATARSVGAGVIGPVPGGYDALHSRAAALPLAGLLAEIRGRDAVLAEVVYGLGHG